MKVRELTVQARKVTAKARNISCEVQQFVLMGHRTSQVDHCACVHRNTIYETSQGWRNGYSRIHLITTESGGQGSG